jgi:CO dehydrogenase/acetyl-CoA synthase delta subunit
VKNIFGKKKSVPQSYQPVLEAQEVLDVFGRLTLHQQAVLMRLMSRNLVIELPTETVMGYELDWTVDKAMIVALPAEEYDVGVTPALQSPADA